VTTTTTYLVSGMTCGHCVSAVTDELSHVPGVQEVQVDLQPDANSSVTVTSVALIDESAIREAIDEAGYTLVGA